jgi:triosephosphate isomerase
MPADRARRPLVAANWKMNLLRRDAEAWCLGLAAGLAAGEPAGELAGAAAEVVVFPSFPLLPVVAAGLAGTAAAWGGQDLHPADAGAHTGDVSAAQLADAGCRWALCGHSERRHDHGESDERVAAKIRAARRHGLVPLVCVGETAGERRAGWTFEVLGRQLAAALDALAALDDPPAAELVLAYEPVWAIGSGETATPETAQEAHRFLRDRLSEWGAGGGTGGAGAARIVYGGSVKPDNAAALAAQADVDGFLVGGASLDPEQFLAIIRVCG